MIPRLLTALHLLDLDIVLGVIAGGALARRAGHADLPHVWFAVVPAVTWTIYVVDRLLDVWRRQGQPSTIRHAFHQRHRTVLTMAVAVVLVLIGMMIVRTPLPTSMWIAAVAGVVLVGAHQALHRITSTPARGLVKDVNVIVTYGFAIWSVPLIDAPIGPTLLLALCVHVIAAFLIVVEESIADVDVDARLDQPSMARSVGPGALRRLSKIAVMFGILASVTLLIWDPVLAVVCSAMIMGSALLPRLFRTSLPMPVRRSVAELVLAIPLLLFVI